MEWTETDRAAWLAEDRRLRDLPVPPHIATLPEDIVRWSLRDDFVPGPARDAELTARAEAEIAGTAQVLRSWHGLTIDAEHERQSVTGRRDQLRKLAERYDALRAAGRLPTADEARAYLVRLTDAPD